MRYYEDISNGFLLAYERSSEFFVRFIPEVGEWEDCNISFSEFIHDYNFREISVDEAMKKSNGRLPDEEHRRYMDMLNRNRGLI